MNSLERFRRHTRVRAQNRVLPRRDRVDHEYADVLEQTLLAVLSAADELGERLRDQDLSAICDSAAPLVIVQKIESSGQLGDVVCFVHRDALDNLRIVALALGDELRHDHDRHDFHVLETRAVKRSVMPVSPSRLPSISTPLESKSAISL